MSPGVIVCQPETLARFGFRIFPLRLWSHYLVSKRGKHFWIFAHRLATRLLKRSKRPFKQSPAISIRVALECWRRWEFPWSF